MFRLPDTVPNVYVQSLRLTDLPIQFYEGVVVTIFITNTQSRDIEAQTPSKLEVPILKYSWYDSRAYILHNYSLSHKQLLWLESSPSFYVCLLSCSQTLISLSMTPYAPTAYCHFQKQQRDNFSVCAAKVTTKQKIQSTGSDVRAEVKVLPLPLDLAKLQLPHLLNGNNSHPHLLRIS